MNEDKTVLSLKNVTKSFKTWSITTKVLKWISFDIMKWDFVALMWHSWSGKSTTLNMIWLLDEASSWEIIINWNKVSELHAGERSKLRSKYFGFIFQQYNLMPWLSAYENITLPLIFSGQKWDIEKIHENIQNIWLSHRMHSKPSELSWWEQQRVAILRALANDPDIIIWDEPTWNLDSHNWKKVLEVLIDLNKKKRKTLILVTHDERIWALADYIIRIKDWKLLKSNTK